MWSFEDCEINWNMLKMLHHKGKVQNLMVINNVIMESLTRDSFVFLLIFGNTEESNGLLRSLFYLDAPYSKRYLGTRLVSEKFNVPHAPRGRWNLANYLHKKYFSTTY